MSLNLKKRWEIVFLSRHKLGPKLSQREIAKEIGCSKSTVNHWLACFERTGDVLDETGRGRKRKTSKKEDEMIVSMATSSPQVSSQTISDKLERRGVSLSNNTIRRRLKEAGFSYGNPYLSPFLMKSIVIQGSLLPDP